MRVVVAALFLAVLASALPTRAEVTAGAGSIQLGATAKWVYAWSHKDEDSLWAGRDDFTTTLVETELMGALSENISYHLELTASYNPERARGGLNGIGNPNEIGFVGVRQASISFAGIPYTTIKLGTFIPPITNYMPRPVRDLDLIQYPLLNNAARMNPDLFVNDNQPPTRDLSTWQNAGVNVTVQLPYFVSLDVGMWNGIMPNQSANMNATPAKATSIVLTYSHDDRMDLSLAYWGEEFQAAFPGLASGAKRELTVFWLYGAYRAEIVEIYADYGQGLVPEGQLDSNGEFQNLTWEAWQITAIYWLKNDIELLVRYEETDPNTVDNVQVAESRYDNSRWLTLGVNYHINEHATVSANYVFKWEEAWEIDEGDINQDPNLPGYNPKWSAQNNDLLMIQVQVWQ